MYSHLHHTLRRTERDMIKNIYWSSCKVPVIFCEILMKFEFSRQFFSKNSQISNFMKIRPVGAELCHADGRTDRRTGVKLIVVFRNFRNAPKKAFRSYFHPPVSYYLLGPDRRRILTLIVLRWRIG